MKRILRNCGDHGTSRHWQEIVGDMNVWMKRGGHTERFRQIVTIRAVENVRKSLKNNKTGTKKMFRSREEIEEFWERRGGKVDNQDWFRKGGATGVLYIPSTEGEVLKKEVERVLAREVGPRKQKLKIVERPGPSVKQQLVRNNPFQRKGCNRLDCPLGGESCKDKCSIENIGYNISCSRCYEEDPLAPPKLYVGETSRCLYTRAKGHLGDLKGRMKGSKTKSWMGDHVVEVHNGDWNQEHPWEDWNFDVESKFQRPLERQINEGIRIRRAKLLKKARIGGKMTDVSGELFNSKDEWNSHVTEWDIV